MPGWPPAALSTVTRLASATRHCAPASVPGGICACPGSRPMPWPAMRTLFVPVATTPCETRAVASNLPAGSGCRRCRTCFGILLDVREERNSLLGTRHSSGADIPQICRGGEHGRRHGVRRGPSNEITSPSNPGGYPMRDPRALIDTATLAASLGDPALRVYDCTTYLEPTPAGSPEPYNAVPGRKTFEDGHIPGADFLDLPGEFSDTGTHLHFMMPPAARLEAAFGRHGIGPGARVVLYSIGTMMWATRFWWMLRSLGLRQRGRARRRPRQVEGRGPPVRISAPRGAIRPQPSCRRLDPAFSSMPRPCWPPSPRDDRDGECAGSAVPSRARAQPLRPAGPGPGQRHRAGGDLGRSCDQGLHHLGRRR